MFLILVNRLKLNDLKYLSFVLISQYGVKIWEKLIENPNFSSYGGLPPHAPKCPLARFPPPTETKGRLTTLQVSYQRN